MPWKYSEYEVGETEEGKGHIQALILEIFFCLFF